MKNKKTLAFILITLTLIVGVLVILKLQPWEIKVQEPTNDNEIEIIGNVKPDNGKKLSCYDAINTLLEKDGFTYLEGTKWGRGEKNFFIVDLEVKEFQMADPYHLEVLPETWYNTEYERYIDTTYRHSTQSVDAFGFDGTNSYVIFTNNTESIMQPTSAFQDFPEWMDYYISQSEAYGCSITGEFNETTLEAYKTQASKATEQDIISVFDLKSTDGIYRTFNDVHVEGDVKNHPRYKELNSFEEFYELKDANGFEVLYMLNIVNSDTKKIFYSDTNRVQSSTLINEFVKDVVYALTPERNDAKMVETLGVYFIDVDNPNGNFESIYTKPEQGVAFDYPISVFGKDIRDFRIPFEGTVVGFEKNADTEYAFIPFSIFELNYTLEMYIADIKLVNPSVVFSEDFIWNYTRPFAYEWQKQMGLTKLFDEKYGFIDHSIKYMN